MKRQFITTTIFDMHWAELGLSDDDLREQKAIMPSNAESRIGDADMAKEMMEFVRNNILN